MVHQQLKGTGIVVFNNTVIDTINLQKNIHNDFYYFIRANSLMQPKLFKYIKNNNFSEATKLLHNQSFTFEKSSLKQLIYNSISVNLVYMFDKEKRKKRNQFCKALKESFSKQNINEEINILEERLQLIIVSEDLFDDILRTNKSGAIRSKNQVQQYWAHIYLAQTQIELITKYMLESLEEKIKSAPFTITHEMMFRNENGQSTNPTMQIENIISTLGMNIHMLAREFNNIRKKKLIIPYKSNTEKIKNHENELSQKTAMDWSELNKILTTCLLFGGKVKKNGATPSSLNFKPSDYYSYVRKETTFELIDNISSLRVMQTFTQYAFDVSLNIKESYINRDNFTTTSLYKDFFISPDELIAIVTITEIFHVNIFQDKTKYSGLTLLEWIRGYSLLKAESEDRNTSDMNVTLKSIITKLNKIGFTYHSALRFIARITFSLNSKDLYECPLIRTSTDSFFIFKPALQFAIISKAILSRLSSLKANVAIKGVNFEKACINMFKSHSKYGLECKAFKFNINGEYEYDAVVLWEDKAFIFECKNTLPSDGRPLASFNNKKLLDKTILQIKRLKNGLSSHPNEFANVFQKKLSNYEIIPVILFCFPFSWIGKYEGVYITDWSCLVRFFKEGAINKRLLKDGDESITEKINLWEGEKPCANDLINQFEKPLQVTRYLNHRYTKEVITYTSLKKGFIKLNYINDIENMKLT